MCAAVVPQHPPTIFAPASRNRREYCAIYSGEHKYKLRPSTVTGSPAFGITLNGFVVCGAIASIASSSARGPDEQFSPITSTGHCVNASAMFAAEVPSSSVPSSSIATCAISGISRPAASRTASTASRSSSKSRNDSRMIRSTPASTSAATCSRNKSRASAKLTGPNGSSRTPNGPTAPATKAWSCATSLAIRTPAWLICRSFSANPNPASRLRFAP